MIQHESCFLFTAATVRVDACCVAESRAACEGHREREREPREGEGEGGICTLVYLLTSMLSRAEARRAFLSGFNNTSYLPYWITTCLFIYIDCTSRYDVSNEQQKTAISLPIWQKVSEVCSTSPTGRTTGRTRSIGSSFVSLTS